MDPGRPSALKRTGAADKAAVRGVCDPPLHEGATAQEGTELGPHQQTRAEYAVRGKRGDFESLISEDLFYQVQSVLSGRAPRTSPA
jgi:hypothetical protein